MERERPYTLFHGWCNLSYTCYQYVAGLGLELAILGSAVSRLTVDCDRESGLQKRGLLLRPLAKTRMHFLNVSHLMTKPTKWPLRPAKTQISLGIRLVWSKSSQCAQWVAEDPMFFMRTAKTLIRLGGCPGWFVSSLSAMVILLVLSCGGSCIHCSCVA